MKTFKHALSFFLVLSLLLVFASCDGGEGEGVIPIPASLNTSFNPEAGATGTIDTIAFQSDGKILIGGTITGYDGTTVISIARINSDGSLDTSFNYTYGPNGSLYSIALQDDGKILIGGFFNSYSSDLGGIDRKSIARLNSDGTIDTTFDSSSGANETVTSIAVQDDGKIIIAGSFTTYEGISRNRIARLNSDGSLDTTFVPGTGADNTIRSIALLNNGKIIIVGNFTDYDGTTINKIARLNSDGSLDTDFDAGIASGAVALPQTIEIQGDGKILIGGWIVSFNGSGINHIVRLNSDGSLDNTFDPGDSLDAEVRDIAVQADGKILICGGFTEYDGVSRNRIARLNSDGSMDETFNPGTGAGTEKFIQCLGITAGGTIFIGGNFTEYNGTSINGVALLWP